MSRLLWGLALLFAAPALGQSAQMPIDSPWAPWDSSSKHIVSATLLKRDAAGAVSAISGQRVAIGGLGFFSAELRALFPGQKTTPMTVAGVRLFHQAAGTSWAMPEHQVNVMFPADVVVPAGRSLGCTYTMPKTGKGVLKCEVDLTVSTGVILPAPPAPTYSPDGARMPPGTQLVDSVGAKWTSKPAPADQPAGQITVFRNGTQVTTAADFLIMKGGVVYQSDFLSGNGWSRWVGTAWATSAAP